MNPFKINRHTVGVISGWLAFLSVIAAILSVIPFPCEICKRVEGLRWSRDDPGYAETVYITIYGTYTRYLLRKDNFAGDIDISSDDVSSLNTHSVGTTYFNSNKGAPLSDFKENRLAPIGMIYVRGKFSKITILLNSDNNSDFITSQVSDRKQAYELAKSMCPNNYISISE
jgi:hypothetical protein